MSNELTAQQILDMDDVIVEEHPVSEWKNGLVYVRSVSAQERGEIEAAAAQFKESKGKDQSFARDFTVKFAWLTLCDSTGRRLFDKVEDVAKLKQKNAAAIASIAEHGQRLSGFSQKDMEQLEKKSETALLDGSPSV
jgi:hypothetical protein